MPAPQVDFLIVGQGLAGSILAFELIARGQSVLVIDNNHKGSASQVAAGIINPITGHRLNLTEGFVDYFARAKNFYRTLEKEFDQNIINSIGQIRLLKNSGQSGYFDKRLQQDDYKNFLDVNSTTTVFNNTSHGTALVKQTSIVNTQVLLREIKAWLISQRSYLNTSIDYTHLHFNATGIEYNEIKARGVIFCEGYQAIYNPWLKGLPFKLAKGEVLTIEKPVDDHSMLSWGNWLIPYTNTLSKLGASYAWQDTDLTPSKEVRRKLLDSLESQTGLRATVANHDVGIRPTTTYRDAFIGRIKSQERAYCFNGFGSKGCLTIPTHADLLCDHLLNQTPLPEKLSKWL